MLRRQLLQQRERSGIPVERGGVVARDPQDIGRGDQDFSQLPPSFFIGGLGGQQRRRQPLGLAVAGQRFAGVARVRVDVGDTPVQRGLFGLRRAVNRIAADHRVQQRQSFAVAHQRARGVAQVGAHHVSLHFADPVISLGQFRLQLRIAS